MSGSAEREVGVVPLEDGELHYERAGTGDPLVFLHAGIADRRMWRSQLATLAARFTTVAYDLRGYGGSPPTTAEHSAQRDLEAVLGFLEIERPHLVGCSKGGEIALDFALAHPDQVRSLTLVGSSVSGWEPDEPARPRGYDDMVAAFEAGDLDAAADAAVAIWLIGPNRSVEEVSDDVRALGRSMARIILQNQAGGAGREAPPARPAVAHLEEIETPTLVVSGSEDEPEMLEIANLLAGRIPGAKAVVIEDAGHLSPLEKPDEFSRALVDFLSTV